MRSHQQVDHDRVSGLDVVRWRRNLFGQCIVCKLDETVWKRVVVTRVERKGHQFVDAVIGTMSSV
jgi:hypothetical protein